MDKAVQAFGGRSQGFDLLARLSDCLKLSTEPFTYGPSGKMAVGDGQIWCVSCEGLAALGKV
ncbi:MAG: hypothetical protein WA366_21470, partial [Pseudolabrys sp.]